MIIRDENYYVISAWMNRVLGLTGQKLSVFAIIYSFSQNGTSEFHGSLQYLSDFTGINKRSNVLRVLTSLVKEGYLNRREEMKNGVKTVFYSVNFKKIDALKRCTQNEYRGCTQNEYGGVLKMSTGCTQNDNGGVLKMSTNIKDDNKDDNKEDNTYMLTEDGERMRPKKVTEEEIKEEFAVLWELYPRKLGKIRAYDAYNDARREGVTYEDVKEGIEHYTKQIEAAELEQRYIKYGSTWFEQKCWTDDMDAEIRHILLQKKRKECVKSNFINTSFNPKSAFKKALARTQRIVNEEVASNDNDG